jgi:chromosome segregation ATPase
MRALWEAAVATQLADIVRLRQEAESSREAADTARHEAELRTEMLRTELGDVRAQLAARDSELLELRLESRALLERTHQLASVSEELQSQLATAEQTAAQADKTHVSELAAERVRYDGLSRQLLRETAHQRETFHTERQRLEGDISRAFERLGALEALRDRLLTEVAEQRNAQQQAAAEAAALRALVEPQRQMLAMIARATAKGTSAAVRRPARSAVHTGPRPAPGRKAR